MRKKDSNFKKDYVSLLDHQGDFVLILCIAVYTCLQIAIYFYFFDKHCSFLQAVTDGSSIHFICFISFTTGIFSQYFKFGGGSSSKELFRSANYRKIFLACATVLMIAASSELLAHVNADQIILVDAYETHSIPTQWPEWIVTVPLLVYLGCALEYRTALSFKDCLLIGCTFLTIFMGFLSYIFVENNHLKFIFLPSSTVFYLMATYLALTDSEKQEYKFYASELTQRRIMQQFQRKCRIQVQRCLYLGMFHYFPLVILLDYCSFITPVQAIWMNSVGSLGVKLIFCVYLIALHSEIQDKFVTEQEIAQRSASLEEELRDMVANVAHDLKTPLTGIMTGIELLDDNFWAILKHLESVNSGDSDMKLYVKNALHSFLAKTKDIHAINTFMVMAINRCLDCARSKRGMELTPRKETVCLSETVDFVLKCMASHNSKDINLVPIPISKEICTHIITDKQWLQENLLCLLSNAVKYSDHGDVTLEIDLVGQQEISEATNSDIVNNEDDFLQNSRSIDSISSSDPVQEGNLFLRIRISDHGVGLSSEQRLNLFHPFQQAQRMAGGCGLGLYSLSKRINSLRGAYGVLDRQDGCKGSMFWFSIPYCPDKEHYNEVSAKTNLVSCDPEIEVRSLSDDNSRSTNRRVLLVDDSAIVIKMTKAMLIAEGFQVTVASNGEQAVRHVEENILSGSNEAPIIIMDFQMPVLDGFEATRRIRALEMRYLCKPHFIIGNSANSDEGSASEACEIGMNVCMGKPFKKSRFLEIISNID